MSAGSKIEWTDATWNPATGCTKVSPGCDHCYAERITERFHGLGSFAEVKLHPDRLDAPQRWRKPRRVFVNSMSDLFHADVPDEFIAKVFAVMAATPRHTYQVLTKRHARMRSLLGCAKVNGFLDTMSRFLLTDTPRRGLVEWPPPNVWLGVSVEDQHWADIRIPALLDTPAAVRFLSCEPLLGPLDLRRWLPVQECEQFGGLGPLDNHVSHDRGQQGRDIGGAGDGPVSHWLPSSAFRAGVVPSDNASDCLMQPLDDLGRGAVDVDPHAASAVGRPSHVQRAFAVEHPGDVTEHRGISGDRDATDRPLPSLSPDPGVRSPERAPDRPSPNAEAASDLVDRLTGQVGVGDLARGNRDRLHEGHYPTIDWLIVGGESGAGARPMYPQWARDLRDQCVAAGVAYFFKQWGEWRAESELVHNNSAPAAFLAVDGTYRPLVNGKPTSAPMARGDAITMRRVGKHAAGRELDGRTWDEYPGGKS